MLMGGDFCLVEGTLTHNVRWAQDENGHAR